jgi:hypothetical protein
MMPYADPLKIRQSDSTLVLPPGNYLLGWGVQIQANDTTDVPINTAESICTIGTGDAVTIARMSNNAATRFATLDRTFFASVTEPSLLKTTISSDVSAVAAGTSYFSWLNVTSV